MPLSAIVRIAAGVVVAGVILGGSGSATVDGKQAATPALAPQLAPFDRLAAQLVAAGSERDRQELLDADPALLTDDLRRALSRLGNRFLVQGEYEQALKAFERAFDVAERLGNRAGMAVALNDAGVARRSLAQHAEAIALFHRSLAISTELGTQREIARTTRNWGAVEYDRGNFRGALRQFHRALELLGETSDDLLGVQIRADTFGDIAVVHDAQGSDDLALDYHGRALALYRAINQKGGTAMTLERLGNIHRKRGEFANALGQYRESLRLAAETHQTYGIEGGVAALLSVTGDVFAMQGRYAEALRYKHQALARYETLAGGNAVSRSVTATLNDVADLHLRLGNVAEGLPLASRAAAIARTTANPDGLWRAQTLRGKASMALGDRRIAREALQEAVATIEGIREAVAGAEAHFFEDRLVPYHLLVEALVAEGKVEEALSYAERARARALLDVLGRSPSSITKSMTSREQEQERRLLDELRAMNRQRVRMNLGATQDAAQVAELDRRVQAARLAYDAFQIELYTAHPELKVRRGLGPALTAEKLDRLVPDAQTALLEFVVADESAFLFVVTRGARVEVSAFRLPVSQKALAAQAQAFRTMIANLDNRFAVNARELHRLLLGAAAAQLRGKSRLVIVPDGPLWDLPFQALQSPAGRDLIDDYTMFSVPSLTVLQDVLDASRPPRHASPTVLAIGNPTPALGLEPLADAERQIKGLTRIYGAARVQTQVGAGAREDRFKEHAANFDVVHLATHGLLDDRQPMYSSVLLTPGVGSGADDGLLEAWEVMALDLRAELVTLSACETARGRIGRGEGVIGFTWALFVAGVSTTVVSQWKVRADSTADLMIGFHRRLQQQLSKPGARRDVSQALRLAALDVKRDPRYRHPFYWAPFVVVGNGY